MLMSVIGTVSRSFEKTLIKNGIKVYEGYYITIEGKHLMTYTISSDGFIKAIAEITEDINGSRFGEAYAELLTKVRKQKLEKLLEK